MCCPRGLKRVERESDHSQLSSNIEIMKFSYGTWGYRGVVFGLLDVMPRTFGTLHTRAASYSETLVCIYQINGGA